MNLKLDVPNCDNPPCFVFKHSYISIVLASLLALVSFALPIEAFAQTQSLIEITQVKLDNYGEIARVDAHGKILQRYAGLGQPLHFEKEEGGIISVLNQWGKKIYRFDALGQLLHTWLIPDYCGDAHRFEFLENGNVLVAAGGSGAIELDYNSQVVWKSDIPVPGSLVTGAIRLSEGSTVLSVRLPDRGIPTLYLASVDGSEIKELPFKPIERARNITNALRAGKDEIAISDDNWDNIYLVSFSGKEIASTQRVPVVHPFGFAPDGGGGFILINEDFSVVHQKQGKEIAQFKFPYRPRLVLPSDVENEYLIAYFRVPDAVWPEAYFDFPEYKPFAWIRFYIWLLMTAFLSAIILGVRRHNQVPIKDQSIEQPSSAKSLSVWESIRKVLGLSVFITGFYLAYIPAPNIDLQLSEAFGSNYGIGVGLMILSTFILFAGRAFDSTIRWTTPGLASSDRRLLLIVIATTTLLSIFTLATANNTLWYPDRVGSWVSSLLLIISLVAPVTGFRKFFSKHGKDCLLLLIPLTVGAVTLFYNLLDIPSYYHFDFTFYVLAGINLVEGRYPSIWSFGFVPAPVIGLLPHILVYEVLGNHPLVFRLGASIVGLLGIPAIYALGKMWKDRQTGLLASILLAGNVSYIHLNRMPSSGEATIVSLFALVLFLQAWRSADYRSWILTGLICGLSIYQWPVARTGAISIFLCWTCFTLYWPRRSLKLWYGPVLLAFSFFLTISPLIPIWIADPSTAIPRVRESMHIYDFSAGGFNWNYLMGSLGEPFLQSLNWFFFAFDKSGQGSISPGLNPIETLFFVSGFALICLRATSTRVLLLIHFVVVLFICGIWADSPPWSTRLLPAIPIVCLLIARLLREFSLELGTFAPRWRSPIFGCVILGTLVFCPFTNFKKYVLFENKRPITRLGDISLLGRELRKAPENSQVFLVLTERPDWSLVEGGRLGELIPFILNRKVREVRDLGSVLPLTKPEPAVFLLQAVRIETDFASIRGVYPKARLQKLFDGEGFLSAGMVFVDDRSQD